MNKDTLQEFIQYGNSTFDQEFLSPDLTFSVCSIQDIKTWQQTSLNLLEYIPSKYYAVIVPDDEVFQFRVITDKKINVIPETAYIGDLKTRLAERILDKDRIGWYLQQFIKLSILKEAREAENYLIWDADTVPLKKIGFFKLSGEVEFYAGTESHLPYFDVTQKLLGFGKVAPFSFIAQSLPCKGFWAKEFFQFIESRCQDTYVNAIVDRVDFNQNSGFSEYETLGSFIHSRFQDQIKIKSEKWFRNGCGLIGGIENLDHPPYNQLLQEFDHITFERWEEPFSVLSIQSKEFVQQFTSIEKSSKPTLDKFLDEIFYSKRVRTITQIGANDGVQNDPLFKYLISPGDYEATLVEPIPFYVAKLKSLYADRSDVKVVQAAAGDTEELLELFFIPPNLATEMNGDGPKNDWAHGQGSFDKNTVIYWIEANSFRGSVYKSKIDFYISSITSIKVPVLKTENLLPRDRNGLLLLIDVQGFEISVLNGIDWNNPPQWIVVEDDLDKTFDILKYFLIRGFQWVAGQDDKLFMRA